MFREPTLGPPGAGEDGQPSYLRPALIIFLMCEFENTLRELLELLQKFIDEHDKHEKANDNVDFDDDCMCCGS